MITFGLTGGIASGKSTVTKTLRAHGIPIVDADIVARQVVEPGTVGLQALVFAFGKEYLQADGTLDRIKLGKLVFADPIERGIVDRIMMPIINEESSRQIKALHDAGNKIVGYDAALICEMGNADKYRPLIVVHCDPAMQLERLMSRNSLTHEEALARINAQMPVEEKVKMGNFVINTSGTLEESKFQTEVIIHRLHTQMYVQMVDNKEISIEDVPHPQRGFVVSAIQSREMIDEIIRSHSS